MDILDSLSRRGKKLKDRLRGKKHKPDSTGASPARESARSSGSLPRSEPHVIAGGRDGEGNRASTDIQQDRSRGQSPQPEPVPASGGDEDRQRREADVDKKKFSQRHSHLDPDVEAGVGVGRKIERVRFSPSTGELDST